MNLQLRFFSRAVYFLLFSLILGSPIQAQTGSNSVAITYSYPYPNSIQVSAKTTIGIRFAEPIVKSGLQTTVFSVLGTASGIHTGKITLALDGRTLIFTPDKIFYSGERVIVNVTPIKCYSGKLTVPYSFPFTISKSKILPSSLSAHPQNSGSGESSFITPFQSLKEEESLSASLPSDFPNIYITQSNDPAAGDIYLDNFTFARNDSGNYLIKLDNSGKVLFNREARPAFAMDFKPQPNGLLTYFDADPFKFKFYGMDSNHVVIDSFEAANGYSTDSHELIFLPGGGFALLAQVDQAVDMRSVIGKKGDSNSTVAIGILQQFDANKNLIFEWRTLDHFAITDPTHEELSSTFIDFSHCNSIDFDADSTFLLSSRNLDEVTKIDPDDGHIIWRWGGKNNQFTFINDTIHFSHQHAVHRISNGNILMYDNGNFRPQGMNSFSRAAEYKLDEKLMTATKVWEYRHYPEIYADAMGYVQQLDNGNRLISWGGSSVAAMTEIKPDNSTALEVKFDSGIYTYRAFKFTKDQTKASSSTSVRPTSLALNLDQNYPNPFVNSSIINFKTSERAPIRLIVFDELGREVKTLFNGTIDAGNYTVKFDAHDLAAGTYLYKLSSPTTSLTKVMTLIK